VRLLSLAAVLLVLAGLPAAAPDQANAPELPLGHFSLSIVEGYSGYGLPVANSALGRQWAANTALAWQMAYDYSVIPVRVDILHRQAIAFRGRVELVNRHNYALAEAAPGPVSTVCQEFIAPPSVPVSVMLAPRVCPPSRPGAPVRMLVRIFQRGSQSPLLEEEIAVMQLEPAHLYSLLLDGPTGAIYEDWVNADNHTKIAPAPGVEVLPEAWQSRHYLIATERQQVTLLPLGARDFAFVFADLAKVRKWPEEEQQALVTYMLGGGYLCLFNTGGQRWQGLATAGEPCAIGRGWLLPVPSGLSFARAQTRSWLEGELSELALWAGGSVNDERVRIPGLTGRGALGVSLQTLYGPLSGDEKVLSHRPGYLHPVWLYRQSCRAGALEPWDYPEFSQAERDILAGNRNLEPLRYLADPASTDLPPLVHLAVTSRGSPFVPIGVAIGAMIAFGLAALRRSIRWLAVPIALLVLAVGGTLWWRATPLPQGQARTQLVDCDTHATGAVMREIAASTTDPVGDCVITVSHGAILRRVNWTGPTGEWRWDTDLQDSTWYAWGGGQHVALAMEYPADDVSWPVTVTTKRLDPERVRIMLDTSQLDADEYCYLVTPLGWLAVTGGQAQVQLDTIWPVVPVEPGLERLQAIREMYRKWRPFTNNEVVVSNQSRSLLQLVGQPLTDPDAHTAVERLGWVGVVQNPLGMRSLVGGQGVVLAAFPNTRVKSEAPTASFLRLCFNAERAP